MDECMDGMFEKWYDKIDEEDSMEDRRKVLYIPVHRRHKSTIIRKPIEMSFERCQGKQMALTV